MTVLLRPHHLLCILTHVGRGYSPAFTANMAAIIERVSAGEEIEIVDGPDDICAPLLHEEDAHCRRDSVIARDRAASDDIGKVLQITVRSGARLSLDDASIQYLRSAFADMRLRSACEGCAWASLCSDVAAARYAGTCLHGKD
ncbi:hypothetical protein SAMN05421853_11555 [Roseivivax halotolerans]|uniref:2Fe-2S ferredoxin n=1 Tax=Roseivivax halotolerans TaxID=93684 RepID=A0A1I6A6H8_9RHOB|nr:DUF1284 domain-containing protein [Roseivivax halotolerans]SFQ64331.1 hypothetical protein SAMN05421853_11555 [Roseivivax halotolerans]